MTAQLLAMAVLGAVLYPLLKKESPALAVLFAVGVAVSLLMVFCSYAETAFTWLPMLQNKTGQEAFSCLMKAAGIILCADYGRDLCKDAGSESMATCVAVAGRVMVLVAAMPLIENVYLSIMELSR